MDWPDFFRGIFYSFLPRVYWRGWRPSSTVDFVRSAVLSGLLECSVCLYFLIVGFWHFLASRAQQLQPVDISEGTRLYLLGILSLEYLFHPWTLIGIVFAGEGALRASAAFFTDEVIPSLPIRLIAFAQGRLEARRKAASGGPDIPDLFERVPAETCDVRISAQRSKDGWRSSVTVAVEGEFYEIAQVVTGAGLRPFVYLLRKIPAGAVMRGMYRYDPPASFKEESTS